MIDPIESKKLYSPYIAGVYVFAINGKHINESILAKMVPIPMYAIFLKNVLKLPI